MHACRSAALAPQLTSACAAARYYVTMDILRRVLEDYFGYTTTFVMNVTDVDDKIIRRARLQHLLEQYLARTPETGQVPPSLSLPSFVETPYHAAHPCLILNWGCMVSVCPYSIGASYNAHVHATL